MEINLLLLMQHPDSHSLQPADVDDGLHHIRRHSDSVLTCFDQRFDLRLYIGCVRMAVADDLFKVKCVWIIAFLSEGMTRFMCNVRVPPWQRLLSLDVDFAAN
ncbi:hypothetical protein DKM44_02135 [Deinococcus irradiatisoli]|uniref:Uncharacterized protein n=1 Tax=Deinococcus irradiatisoli TaxID=2202254 RepID=A0A2Z3JJS0_9DEIO|nr:hypothetical protein DKM44_02135 [Deinococcus irradiatisoli]